MAPIRRYLRITKYSVLEVRIYLDNPALAQSWLLNPRNPVLPRVMESVRPLVLPKLREEQERSRTRRKGAKKRNIKDVVVQDDFEVSIFLVETSTRHSLLHKQKHFRDKTQTKLISNSSRLTGASHFAPIDVNSNPCPIVLDEDDDDEQSPPGLRHEDSDSADALTCIPATTEPQQPSRTKRRRGHPSLEDEEGREDDAMNDADDDEDLFVENSESEDSDLQPPPPKRARDKKHAAAGLGDEDTGGKDDTKKKMAMDISYDGFALHGRVLCLVVRRRNSQQLGAGNRSGATTTLVRGGKGESAAGGGQAQMENWITSTQMVPAAADDGDTDAT